jgi:hypothetical protein
MKDRDYGNTRYWSVSKDSNNLTPPHLFPTVKGFKSTWFQNKTSTVVLKPKETYKITFQITMNMYMQFSYIGN